MADIKTFLGRSIDSIKSVNSDNIENVKTILGSNVNQNTAVIAATNLSLSFQESNRDYSSCNHYLINESIDSDYRNYLIYNLLINI